MVLSFHFNLTFNLEGLIEEFGICFFSRVTLSLKKKDSYCRYDYCSNNAKWCAICEMLDLLNYTNGKRRALLFLSWRTWNDQKVECGTPHTPRGVHIGNIEEGTGINRMVDDCVSNRRTVNVDAIVASSKCEAEVFDLGWHYPVRFNTLH